jgi:wyosine [tRNA(Phe)-imidazoG37] synthetase (radical SAM superfamily)
MLRVCQNRHVPPNTQTTLQLTLPPTVELTTTDHNRDITGMTYVYPVVSRRACGVSIGINLNPNNACNWRCIYCQVPNLKRGGPPSIDLAQLERELHSMIHDVVLGDFMHQHVPEGLRRLNDIALSGNGEPTSAAEFSAVIELVGQALIKFGLLGKIKLVLITNGSLSHRPSVQAGIQKMAALNGEVWFKFDRATQAGLRQVNDTAINPDRHFQRLKRVSQLCPTWVQTCMFAEHGLPPSEVEVSAYLDMLQKAKTEHLPLRGVLLYGLARTSTQPEAEFLNAVPESWLRNLAHRIESIGIDVRVTP